MFADAVLSRRLVSAETLRTFGMGQGGRRGVAQCRATLELADDHSRSAWESRLRVFYQLRAGLPRPQVNVPLFDRTGRLLGIADLFDEDAAFVCEFDGQDHRQRRQHRADNVREEGLEATGLTVVRADSLDLRHFPEELERRLRSGWQQKD